MKNTLLTLNLNDVLGDNSRDSMKYCAEQWGSEFIEVTSLPWDGPYMHGACYKTKAFDLCDADRIFIIDADTVMRSDTPNPFELFPSEQIVAVFQKRGWGPNDGIERSEWEKCEKFCESDAERVIVNLGKTLDPSLTYFNSGVMIVNRDYHEVAFSRAYEICLKQGFSWYDQTPINFSARCDMLNVFGAGNEWNHFNPDWERPSDWKKMKSFIYHFAGNPGRKEKIQQVQWKL